MATPTSVAQAIPQKVRAWIYLVLGALYGLELIWDVVPDALEGKFMASLGVLGFSLAALNTRSK